MVPWTTLSVYNEARWSLGPPSLSTMRPDGPLDQPLMYHEAQLSLDHPLVCHMAHLQIEWKKTTRLLAQSKPVTAHWKWNSQWNIQIKDRVGRWARKNY